MILFATAASTEAGWTNLYALKEGAAPALIAVLKTENNGSILGGITLPTVTSSFVRSTSDTPPTMPSDHLQILA